MSCGEALTFIFFPLLSLVPSSEHRSPNLQKQLLYIAQVAITPILHQLPLLLIFCATYPYYVTLGK